jgi:hypothetical protein
MARPKGSPNVLTKTIREAILSSFETVGGEAWLAKLAKDDPRSYAGLLAKAMPTQVEGSDGGPVQIQIVTAVPVAEDDQVDPTESRG